MKVRMKIQLTGTRNGAYWPAPDGEVDLPDAEAAKMVRVGYAARVEAPVEAAVAPPVETATTSTTTRPRKPRR